MKNKILFPFLFVIILIVIIRINESPPEYHTETYIVQAGDTAWKIMNDHNYANKDIRELIYYMEKDNGIKAGYLQIGQEIKIRIYEEGIDMNRNKKSDASAGTLIAPDK